MMKRIAVFSLLALFTASVFAADTPAAKKKAEGEAAAKKSTPPPTTPIRKGDIKLTEGQPPAAVSAEAESALVKAARSGSGKRGKSKLSISDADVKKSTGKLSLVGTRSDYDPAAVKVPATTPDTTQADRKRRSDAAQKRLAAARKEVDDLETELSRVEDDYYSEDNPDYREEVIEERFEKTKKQLDRARKELTDAREEAAKY